MPPGEGWWCKRALCSLIADETAETSSSRSIRNSRMGGSGEIVADKAAFESRYEFRKTLGDGGQVRVPCL